MIYDVEVKSKGGWATDMTASGKQALRRVLNRRHELRLRGQVARIYDRYRQRVREEDL